jgi:hypothetical protein
MKKTALFLLLVFAGVLAQPARAQFIGTVSPQTVQATLANAKACTGAEQDFDTGVIPGFRNLGITQHAVTATSPNAVTEFRMVIEGIDNQGNVVPISDVGQINGSINASGYFPLIRVAVTCLPAVTGTFTMSYSGGSATTPVIAGSFFSSLIDKLILNGASASVNQTVGPMSTPFGSSAGKLLFQYVGGAVAGSSIAVTCQGSTTIGGYSAFSFNLENTASIQQFSIPAGQCPSYTVAYTSGGAAGTALLEYIFDYPGALPSATQLNGCQTQDNNLGTTLPITVGANTTVRIVAPTAGKKIAVCTLVITAGVAGTVQATEGTGGTCGTGSSNLSGAMTLAVGTPLSVGASAPAFNTQKTTDELCLTTAGGATVAGWISFIYTPI